MGVKSKFKKGAWIVLLLLAVAGGAIHYKFPYFYRSLLQDDITPIEAAAKRTAKLRELVASNFSDHETYLKLAQSIINECEQQRAQFFDEQDRVLLGSLSTDGWLARVKSWISAIKNVFKPKPKPVSPLEQEAEIFARYQEAADLISTVINVSNRSCMKVAGLAQRAALYVTLGKEAEAHEVLKEAVNVSVNLEDQADIAYVMNSTYQNIIHDLGILGHEDTASILQAWIADLTRGKNGARFLMSLAHMKKLTDEQYEELEMYGAIAVEKYKKAEAEKAAKQNETTMSRSDVDNEYDQEGEVAIEEPSQCGADGEYDPHWWLGNAGNQNVMVSLNFGLFKARHSRKNYTAAFEALQLANDLQAQVAVYNNTAFGDKLMRMADIFPPDGSLADQIKAARAAKKEAEEEEAANAQKDGNATSANSGGEEESKEEEEDKWDASKPSFIPIFVTGLPRSGTSLLEQVFASHPLVWGAGENSPMSGLVQRLINIIADRGEVSWNELEAMGRAYKVRIASRVPPDRLNVKFIVDKGIGNVWNVGYIPMIMPEACILHSVRHPADCGLSNFEQSFMVQSIPWSFNLTHIGQEVALHHRVMSHWDAAMPGSVFHVHYSDLVTDMEGTAKKIFKHCGLPWDERVLKFYETPRAVATASQSQVRQPVYTTSLDKWKVYSEGLKPMLRLIRGTIARYERWAGLPSSAEFLNELFKDDDVEQGQNKDGESVQVNETGGKHDEL